MAQATEYTDPGYLVYSDVLPVRDPDGRRYLTSARVERLLGPDGKAVASTDGVTEPVAVPDCRAVRADRGAAAHESLPRGRAADRCSTWVRPPKRPATPWYATRRAPGSAR